ncbi:hypothetical protein EZV62_003517 [Acer yangbiense]|uniref:Uncharacterized protein n=1 Tax=Acer yangbiense TaxID=1000413 RepID=A0A5C7IIU1_9ROSI|nr:hypothetical protein EZV62_003517 [Acer yangbiense]
MQAHLNAIEADFVKARFGVDLGGQLQPGFQKSKYKEGDQGLLLEDGSAKEQSSEEKSGISPTIREEEEKEISHRARKENDYQTGGGSNQIQQQKILGALSAEDRARLVNALKASYSTVPNFSNMRYEIVNGLQEVEGVVNGDVTDKEVNKDTDQEKGVPGFWLTAMKNNVIVADEVQRIDDPKGFKLEFFFDPNPYFKNSVLRKTYHIIDDDELDGGESYPGKCLTLKLLKKKPRKGSKNAKPVIKTEKCASFFNFFKPPVFPEDADEIDPDMAEELEDQMDQDYTVG